jgi:hypothetical protein
MVHGVPFPVQVFLQCFWIMPAETRPVSERSLSDMTLSMRLRSITTPPRIGAVPPESPRRLPWYTGIRCSLQNFTTRATCSVLSGNTMAKGRGKLLSLNFQNRVTHADVQGLDLYFGLVPRSKHISAPRWTPVSYFKSLP